MNYNWFWLIIKSYKMGLINRETFIKQWENAQALDDLQGGLEGRKHNERLIYSFSRGIHRWYRWPVVIQQPPAMEVL
jgi:hypothetical protein